MRRQWSFGLIAALRGRGCMRVWEGRRLGGLKVELGRWGGWRGGEGEEDGAYGSRAYERMRRGGGEGLIYWVIKVASCTSHGCRCLRRLE
jgi:hypothetical protein